MHLVERSRLQFWRLDQCSTAVLSIENSETASAKQIEMKSIAPKPCKGKLLFHLLSEIIRHGEGELSNGEIPVK